MGSLILAVAEAGDYQGCGREYVANMYRMVKRHSTVPFEYHIITDDPDRHDPIDDAMWTYHQTPHDGWWAKLDLFEAGTFDPDDRVLFLDLDTIILANIDGLLRYEGDPAFLGNWRDGGWPISTAAMAFRAGDVTEIGREWRRQGWPITKWGDDEFVRGAVQKLGFPYCIMQREFPGFRSYRFSKLQKREHLVVERLLGPRVVCFCEQPKPHNAGGWATEEWSRVDARSD